MAKGIILDASGRVANPKPATGTLFDPLPVPIALLDANGEPTSYSRQGTLAEQYAMSAHMRWSGFDCYVDPVMPILKP